MAWDQATFQGVLDQRGVEGIAMEAYSQGQDPLVKGFAQGEGICAGICYCFLRRELTTLGKSGGISGGRSTASARFTQALFEAKLREGSAGTSFGQAIAPIMKRDGLTSRVVKKGQAGLSDLGDEIGFAVEEVMDDLAPPSGTRKVATLLRIRKYTGGGHATAFIGAAPDGPVVFVDPNLGKVRFNSRSAFGQIWEFFLGAYYASKGYGQFYFEVVQ